jgi:transcriptional regulator with XRE-family HTH domain
MLARTPDPLDVTVGARIRILRNHRGMSQGELAGKIGVTFQQVQKYGRGTNRVGASRLSRIASVLGVSVGELFESSENKSTAAKSPFRLLAERDLLRVIKALSWTTTPACGGLSPSCSKASPTGSPRSNHPRLALPRQSAGGEFRPRRHSFLRDTLA